MRALGVGSWSYSGRMYVVPLLEVGLSPVLQWIVLPPLALWFARGQMSGIQHAHGRRGHAHKRLALDVAHHSHRHGNDVAGRTGTDFQSHVFLLDEAGRVQLLPHSVYVALARAEAVVPALAGREFRLADWYVRHTTGGAPALVSEWYGWVQFDQDGAFDPTGWPGGEDKGCALGGKVDTTALPSTEERARMQEALMSAGVTLQPGQR